MQAAGIFVCALSELPASVQIRKHQLDCRHFPFWMDVDWDSAAVVADRNRSIDVNDNFNFGAKSGEMFVDRVVEDFVNQVMQAALIRISDEHSGPLPDGFQAFQFVDLRRVVFLRSSDSGCATRGFFNRNLFLNLRHKRGPSDPEKTAYRKTASKQIIISRFRTD